MFTSEDAHAASKQKLVTSFPFSVCLPLYPHPSALFPVPLRLLLDLLCLVAFSQVARNRHGQRRLQKKFLSLTAFCVHQNKELLFSYL